MLGGDTRVGAACPGGAGGELAPALNAPLRSRAPEAPTPNSTPPNSARGLITPAPPRTRLYFEAAEGKQGAGRQSTPRRSSVAQIAGDSPPGSTARAGKRRRPRTRKLR